MWNPYVDYDSTINHPSSFIFYNKFGHIKGRTSLVTSYNYRTEGRITQPMRTLILTTPVRDWLASGCIPIATPILGQNVQNGGLVSRGLQVRFLRFDRAPVWFFFPLTVYVIVYSLDMCLCFYEMKFRSLGSVRFPSNNCLVFMFHSQSLCIYRFEELHIRHTLFMRRHLARTITIHLTHYADFTLTYRLQ